MTRMSTLYRYVVVMLGICWITRSSDGATSLVTGYTNVTLPGPTPGPGAPPSAVLTGITIRYRERSYLNVDKRIDAYLGVPYAEPPVGDRRFVDPVPHQITGNLNATADRDICPQFSMSSIIPDPLFPDIDEKGISEDCLYLSIYTPSPKPATPAPVMVWIHGGGNVKGSGSSAWYEPLPLVALSDIIVVNVNYRLGVFGFLTTGDNVATGNYGLKDQVLALHWVHDNIAAFGGDPLRVTIAGESAGGNSVGQHMLSPLSRGLFNQAIMQSGNAVCPWSTMSLEEAAAHHRALAESVGCPTGDSQSMVDCMRRVDQEVIVRHSSLYLNGTLSSSVIDGHFMPTDPKELVKRRMFPVMPTLMGTNKDEMESTALILNFPSSVRERPTMNISTFRNMMPKMVYGVETTQEVAAVEQQYIDWSVADNASADQLDGFVRLLTDEYFSCPTEHYARALEAAGADVYRYEMTHSPSWTIYGGTRVEWLGAAHADDLQYVFAWGLNPALERIVSQTDAEKVMSVEFMRYWTNFVISGNPNEPMENALYPFWPKYTMPEQEYKDLSLNMTNGRAMRAADCNFWLNIMPRLHIQTAPMEDIHEDWLEQYDIWREIDVPEWTTAFTEYKKNNVCPSQRNQGR